MLVIDERVADRPDPQGAYFDGSLELLRELAIVRKMLPHDALRIACFDQRGQLGVNASTAAPHATEILREQSGPIRLSEKRRARGMHSSRPSFAPIILLALVFTTSLMLGTAVAAGAGSETEAAEIQAKARRIQDVIDELAGRLSLTRDVVAAIVPLNPLMVSVVSPVNRDGVYRVAFEGAFLDTLIDDELRAVVAHELGHIWIFTHHPYLQTEQLANKIALRVVPRETLERVYHKVWPHGTPPGAPARFPAAAN